MLCPDAFWCLISCTCISAKSTLSQADKEEEEGQKTEKLLLFSAEKHLSSQKVTANNLQEKVQGRLGSVLKFQTMGMAAAAVPAAIASLLLSDWSPRR